MKMSVAMLAKNAADVIEDALASVSWADEVVVGVDDTTTDDTAEMARKFENVRVISVSMTRGFGRAKNDVVEACRNDWVLVMDSDERVTPELERAIDALDLAGYSAYAINRLNFMLGRAMHYGGWWPDYQLRLLDRRHAKYSGKPVHEELQVSGRVGRIDSYFVHLTHPTVASVLDRVQRYSDYEAELIAAEFKKSGRKIGAKALIGPALREFWRRLVLRRAYKDGMPGFIEAVIQSFSVFANYAKAWEMQQRAKDRAK